MPQKRMALWAVALYLLGMIVVGGCEASNWSEVAPSLASLEDFILKAEGENIYQLTDMERTYKYVNGFSVRLDPYLDSSQYRGEQYPIYYLDALAELELEPVVFNYLVDQLKDNGVPSYKRVDGYHIFVTFSMYDNIRGLVYTTHEERDTFKRLDGISMLLSELDRAGWYRFHGDY